MLAPSLTESASTHVATNPARPTTNRSSGTKNRNIRNATALPRTAPADSRSRWWISRPRSTRGRSRYLSNRWVRRFCPELTCALLHATSIRIRGPDESRMGSPAVAGSRSGRSPASSASGLSPRRARSASQTQSPSGVTPLPHSAVVSTVFNVNARACRNADLGRSASVGVPNTCSRTPTTESSASPTTS